MQDWHKATGHHSSIDKCHRANSPPESGISFGGFERLIRLQVFDHLLFQCTIAAKRAPVRSCTRVSRSSRSRFSSSWACWSMLSCWFSVLAFHQIRMPSTSTVASAAAAPPNSPPKTAADFALQSQPRQCYGDDTAAGSKRRKTWLPMPWPATTTGNFPVWARGMAMEQAMNITQLNKPVPL
jgi:hypothetical protein